MIVKNEEANLPDCLASVRDLVDEAVIVDTGSGDRTRGVARSFGAVVAEWMGASSGLGRAMWLAYTNLDMPSLFAAVIVLTLLSAGLYQSVVVVERRSLRWASA